MTVSLPGPMFFSPRSGREATRKKAGRCLVECYEQMLKFYGRLWLRALSLIRYTVCLLSTTSLGTSSNLRLRQVQK